MSARKFPNLALPVKCLVAVGAAMLVVSVASAHAQESKPRPVPDYDGRGARKTTPGDVAIWIPRVVAAPLYLTSEYLIRRPLGAVIMYTEEKRIPQELVDFFTFDKAHKVGVVPTAFVDFGLLPSVGLYFFWDDFLAKNNDLRLRAGTWGPEWLAFGITDRIRLTDRSLISFHAEWTRRQDWLFYGIGPLEAREPIAVCGRHLRCERRARPRDHPGASRPHGGRSARRPLRRRQLLR